MVEIVDNPVDGAQDGGRGTEGCEGAIVFCREATRREAMVHVIDVVQSSKSQLARGVTIPGHGAGRGISFVGRMSAGEGSLDNTIYDNLPEIGRASCRERVS